MTGEYHHKLVRDGVPEKIRQNGEIAETRRLSEEERRHYLGIKMLEEVREAQSAKTRDEKVAEYADMREVFDALLRADRVSWEEVRVVQAKKRGKLGGFDGGVYLISTHKA